MNYREIAERAVLTFLQSFLGVFLVSDLTSARSAAVAGAAAALSFIKSVVASRFGDGTPSVLG